MVKLLEIRIELHVFQKIIHPSHIPLKGKTKSSLFYIACHTRPRCRLLCDNIRPRMIFFHHSVQMAQKFHRLIVFIAAIFIWQPVTVLFPIIQVEHGRHCIHTKPVDMELLDPEQGIGHEKILNLFSSIIKDIGSPVGMLSPPPIRMFVHCLAVKVSKTMGILWKMCWHPV